MATDTSSKSASSVSTAEAGVYFSPLVLFAYSIGVLLVGAAGPLLANGGVAPGSIALATAVLLLAISVYLGRKSVGEADG